MQEIIQAIKFKSCVVQDEKRPLHCLVDIRGYIGFLCAGKCTFQIF